MHGREVEDTDVRDAQSQQATLDELRREVEELRASRERLVLAADAESRAIERALHDGLQQQLVAVAVELQQMTALVDSDPAAAKPLLDELARYLQDALDVSARLAERVNPPLLEQAGRLPVGLRSAAVSAGVAASVDVESVRADLPPEVARTVFLCWLEALEHARSDARPTIRVRDEGESLAFEIVSGATLDRLRDRVEALGGQLDAETTAGGLTQVYGSLPLLRRP